MDDDGDADAAIRPTSTAGLAKSGSERTTEQAASLPIYGTFPGSRLLNPRLLLSTFEETGRAERVGMYGRSPLQVVSLFIIALVLMVGILTPFLPLTHAQEPSPTSTSDTTDPVSTTELAPLEREVIRLQERVAGLSSFVYGGFVILGLLFTVSTGVSVYGFIRAESRARESHALSVAGEVAAQSRASEVHSTFLGSSRQTLDLVNATLELAKEASERAVRSIEENARLALVDLDREAKALLAKVPEGDDNALVADPTRRSELTSLAERISSFETNQQIFPRPITLTPHGFFVRGMQFHLRQQFRDALKYWQEAALRDDSSGVLRSLSWYWIGIERNNLGEFSQAVQSFSKAGETASETRGLELQRISLESRFWNKEKEEASALIYPLEKLLQQTEAMDQTPQVEAHRLKILATLGNVTHEAGNDCRTTSRDDEAMRYYEKALGWFEQAASENKWALFGKAEALHRLGRGADADPIYRGPLRRYAAEKYFDGRVEPRTRVLGRTMELICCVRVPDFWGEVETAHRNVREALSEVDERLTVYSQIQRRNVLQAEFRRDLDELMGEFHEARGQGLPT